MDTYSIYDFRNATAIFSIMIVKGIEIRNNRVTVTSEDDQKYYIHKRVYELDSFLEGEDVDLAELQDRSDLVFCYEQAADYLYKYRKTSYGLKQYLYKKKYTKDVVDKTIERLEQNGYLNDLSFAKDFYELKSRTHGIAYIRNMLISKGIKRDVLDQLDMVEDVEVVIEILRKKFSSDIDHQKATKFLLSRGFSFNTINRALRQL